MFRKFLLNLNFRSIHFKVPAIFGLLFLVSFQLVGVFFTRQLETQLIQNFETQVTGQTNFLANSATAVLQEINKEKRIEKSSELFQATQGQNILNIQIVDKHNEVVDVASQVNRDVVGKLTEEPDVKEVLLTGASKKYQYSSSEGNQTILRVIMPVMSQDRTLMGVVVVDANISSVYVQLQEISSLFLNVMVIALFATVAIAFVISSRGIAKPVSEIKNKTEKIAEGEYDSGDVTVYGNDELGTLANSINNLAIRIKEANASIEAERQRLDSVLKHMSDGVVATDRRGNVVIINEAALRLLDTNEEDVINASIMDVFGIRQKYTYRQLLQTQDELILSSVSEGEETIIRGEFSVIQRESGFISGLVCVLSDITEQEKIDRERKEFVSNVSHELRTPLTSIRSYTEALIDGTWKDDVLAPNFLEVIQFEANRMIRMVADLLNLSKMDAGIQKLELEMIDVTKLLNRILDRFDMLLSTEDYAHKSHKIVREVKNHTLWVEADQDKLTQVIDNIMDNAIKYSPDGGTITCRLVETDDNIVVSVTDQGLGISRKALPHIFKRFYRVDKARSRAQGGTGLGLAISKEVITLHGGNVWVTSQENKGSTFFISLPKVTFYGDEEEW
ncbi:cell wall metabolism sensor histidine kinase WalK [Carnobacteriaceae bacterium zg-84]|uniref:cell wall metabolism sensor histidine kinase WalK n=1 Tax=Granulicatella sp. zg-84 TaxID=2678503 RepID=UPI0013C26340|nr:cell wall metabolism sensor histidine kinase WalK [Granulicatella sp. zg-84]NEW66271.1 cell wall metabolism sensor histidine kinase WalK [Granulicatella sp. zg-84]QMI85641.1 cell wall metabolism sensor histidine kinase WalK [Carnobacteriaceae bacterium zg-84]